MFDKLISIIIPIYNKDKYVSKCLDSILEQDYKNFEIIIIDDGSTDNSLNIIKNYFHKNENIKFYSQNNQGVSAARNKGLELMRGEYIVFIDADDYISKSFLSNFISKTTLKDDIVISGISMCFNNSSIKKIFPSEEKVLSKKEFFKNFLLEQNNNGINGFVCSKFIKSSIIKENNLRFNNDLVLGEDLEFFIRYYSYCNQFRLINDCDYFYLQNVSQNLKVDYKKQLYIQKQIEKVLNDCKALNEENYFQLRNKMSEIKYSFFSNLEINQLKYLNDEISFFKEIKLFKSEGINKKVLKFLIDNEITQLLKQYLQLRHNYIKMKRKWM